VHHFNDIFQSIFNQLRAAQRPAIITPVSTVTVTMAEFHGAQFS
jgi:hypothetical protein